MPFIMPVFRVFSEEEEEEVAKAAGAALSGCGVSNQDNRLCGQNEAWVTGYSGQWLSHYYGLAHSQIFVANQLKYYCCLIGSQP